MKFLNERIEKERKELQYLEMTLKVDRAMDDLNNYPKDFKDNIKAADRERLNVLYGDMNEQEINMLYYRLQNME